MFNNTGRLVMGVLLMLSVGIQSQMVLAKARGTLSEPSAAPTGKAEQSSLAVKPDFSSMVDVKTRKNAFFGYLLPMIKKENTKILQDRERVLALSSQSKISKTDRLWLTKLAEQYRLSNVSVTDDSFFRQLLGRVDMIPASLALAQAANESGWGTSRFAKMGNNFFGQWCFRQGCGIVPKARPEGQRYEVQKFPDVASSVSSYMRNLNTNHQYQALRDLREHQRLKKKPISGSDLAQGLKTYSARGDAYIEELLSMIHSNKLSKYDLTS